MLMLGVWGARPSDVAAQSASAPVASMTISEEEIEQRARFLSLGAEITAQARENFQRLIRDRGIDEDKMRTLQQEVIASNPGKSRDELIAIFKERQKEFGAALQKEAVESARAQLLPK